MEEVPERITEALRIYLAAGWDANWQVVAGRMYRALVNPPAESAAPVSAEAFILRAKALGYQVVFHSAGITLHKTPKTQADTWGFLSLKTAHSWVADQERFKAEKAGAACS